MAGAQCPVAVKQSVFSALLPRGNSPDEKKGKPGAGKPKAHRHFQTDWTSWQSIKLREIPSLIPFSGIADQKRGRGKGPRIFLGAAQDRLQQKGGGSQRYLNDQSNRRDRQQSLGRRLAETSAER